jgi:predicted nucleotidyltransferase
MQETIKDLLKSIGDTYKVRVLLAVESGSRAWGFPSTDSDYDVRFLYVNEPEWYLSLHEERDVIEYTSDDDLLDLNGWDLRKAFRLLLKGNAAVYEWLQSPVIYAADEDFIKRTWEVAPAYFPLKAGLHHYLGVVKGVLDELTAPQVKVKRCFYGLRAALAARWIIEKCSVPPMTFDSLKDPLHQAPELFSFIESLRQEKALKTESFIIAQPQMLKCFLEETVTTAEATFESLPNPQGDKQIINDFFSALVLKRKG